MIAAIIKRQWWKCDDITGMIKLRWYKCDDTPAMFLPFPVTKCKFRRIWILMMKNIIEDELIFFVHKLSKLLLTETLNTKYQPRP